MTAAALSLALALLVTPGVPRHRIGMRPVVYRTSTRGVVVGTAVAGVTIAAVAPATATLAVGVVVATAMLRRRNARGQARRAEEAVALQGALGVLLGELRTGVHPVLAFEAAADETGGSAARSLRAVAARARLGADVVAGLRSVAAHSAIPGHWERLSVCWSLAQTQGLAIVALVRAAERDVVERERFASQVRAGMAGARATTAILAGLPVLGVALGQLIGAEPVRFLLSDGVGRWLLLIGVTLACAGLWWSDRITERTLG